MVELTRDHVRYALAVASRFQHPDPAMRESDALFALLKASRDYREGVGTFLGHVALRVAWAVQDGLREVDHLSRGKRGHVKAGEADDPGPPPSLDALHAIPRRFVVEPQPDVDAATVISVQDALAALDTRGGAVVRMRYHGWTGIETAAFLGVHESRVSQLYRQGLSELRAVLGIDSSVEMLAA